MQTRIFRTIGSSCLFVSSNNQPYENNVETVTLSAHMKAHLPAHLKAHLIAHWREHLTASLTAQLTASLPAQLTAHLPVQLKSPSS